MAPAESMTQLWNPPALTVVPFGAAIERSAGTVGEAHSEIGGARSALRIRHAVAVLVDSIIPLLGSARIDGWVAIVAVVIGERAVAVLVVGDDVGIGGRLRVS